MILRGFWPVRLCIPMAAASPLPLSSLADIPLWSRLMSIAILREAVDFASFCENCMSDVLCISVLGEIREPSEVIIRPCCTPLTSAPRYSPLRCEPAYPVAIVKSVIVTDYFTEGFRSHQRGYSGRLSRVEEIMRERAVEAFCRVWLERYFRLPERRTLIAVRGLINYFVEFSSVIRSNVLDISCNP